MPKSMTPLQRRQERFMKGGTTAVVSREVLSMIHENRPFMTIHERITNKKRRDNNFIYMGCLFILTEDIVL